MPDRKRKDQGGMTWEDWKDYSYKAPSPTYSPFQGPRDQGGVSWTNMQSWLRDYVQSNAAPEWEWQYGTPSVNSGTQSDYVNPINGGAPQQAANGWDSDINGWTTPYDWYQNYRFTNPDTGQEQSWNPWSDAYAYQWDNYGNLDTMHDPRGVPDGWSSSYAPEYYERNWRQWYDLVYDPQLGRYRMQPKVSRGWMPGPRRMSGELERPAIGKGGKPIPGTNVGGVKTIGGGPKGKKPFPNHAVYENTPAWAANLINWRT